MSGLTSNPPSSGGAGYLKNFKPSTLYKFRAALARQATGGAVATIGCVGDSTTAGAISDAALANYRMHSWPKVLADLLTATGYPASSSNAFGANAGTQAAFQVAGYWDSRLSGSGCWVSMPSNITLGGAIFGQTSAIAGNLNFTPGVSTDTCDIWYFDQAAVWTTNVDGGAVISTITGANGSITKKVTISYAAGLHVINIDWVSGIGNVIGFDAYTAASPKIKIWNFGSGGFLSSNLITGGDYSPLGAIHRVSPDLVIISIGINDWIHSVAVATYTSNLQTFITQCLLTGDVILMTPFPSAASQSPLATQTRYVAAMLALATINNIAIIDENFNLVSKTQMTAIGLGSDANHPNNIGHALIAQDVFGAIMSGI
jgi:lysophospholipase L1-like esterase